MHDWQELARNALEALGDHVQRQGCPTWLRIFEDPEDDGGLRLEAEDDSLGLFGWVAPEDCLAVGVIATGRATVSGQESIPVTGESGTREPDALSTRVNDAGGVLPLRIACVVSRSGGLGWWMELPDGTRRSDPPRAGRLLDVLFRCLGLPTSPPDVPASEIHSAAWLASVIEGGLASERRLTWSDVEQLHPLARVLSGDLDLHIGKTDDGDGVAQEELEDLLRIAAAACSWEEIHSQAVEGELDAFIDADVAAWMDEGMLSRWLLSMIPPIDQLLETARPLLVPSAARRLAHAVRRHTPAQPARSSTGG